MDAALTIAAFILVMLILAILILGVGFVLVEVVRYGIGRRR